MYKAMVSFYCFLNILNTSTIVREGAALRVKQTQRALWTRTNQRTSETTKNLSKQGSTRNYVLPLTPCPMNHTWPMSNTCPVSHKSSRISLAEIIPFTDLDSSHEIQSFQWDCWTDWLISLWDNRRQQLFLLHIILYQNRLFIRHARLLVTIWHWFSVLKLIIKK